MLSSQIHQMEPITVQFHDRNMCDIVNTYVAFWTVFKPLPTSVAQPNVIHTDFDYPVSENEMVVANRKWVNALNAFSASTAPTASTAFSSTNATSISASNISVSLST